MSSGVVSQRTRITSSPALPRSSAVSASRTIAPEAAPGDAFRPRVATSISALGSIIGMEELVELRRIDARNRLVARDQLLVHHLDRDPSAAAAVRFPVRVCRMKRRPSSTVNSMSCMSR